MIQESPIGKKCNKVKFRVANISKSCEFHLAKKQIINR